MALEDFNFPYHTVGTGDNPRTGINIQLGNSYVFSAPSTDPDQREFKLEFNGMKYYENSEGTIVDDIESEKNILALYNFYQRHKLHGSFNYTHPLHGAMIVKFKEPLPDIKVRDGGFGVSESFTVELIEIP